MSLSPDRIKQCMTQRGIRATKKRLRVLNLMLEHSPISAYELQDVYLEKHGERLQPTSAYRLIEVLMEAGMVHRVTSINRFIACEHALCAHEHENQQLLVCTTCNDVQEVPAQAVDSLCEAAREYGFQSHEHPMPELLGECAACSNSNH